MTEIPVKADEVQVGDLVNDRKVYIADVGKNFTILHREGMPPLPLPNEATVLVERPKVIEGKVK